MNIKPIHNCHVKVLAEAYDDWLNRQKEVLILTSTRPSELMIGVVLEDNPDKGFTVGQRILFQAFDRENNVFAFPLDGQKLMDGGDYLVFAHAILAELEFQDVSTEAAPLPDSVGDSEPSLGAG